MLEPYHGDPQRDERPAPMEVEGEAEYVVESILRSKKVGRGLHYLVKWKGYGHSENTWENRDTMADTAALKDFEDKQKQEGQDNSGKRKR
jgi:hypothetical protein